MPSDDDDWIFHQTNEVQFLRVRCLLSVHQRRNDDKTTTTKVERRKFRIQKLTDETIQFCDAAQETARQLLFTDFQSSNMDNNEMRAAHTKNAC